MNPPRDRSASWGWHTRQVIDHDSYVTYYLECARASGQRDDLARILPELASALLCRYARGDTLEALRACFLDVYAPILQQVQDLYSTAYGTAPPGMERRGCDSWMLLFAFVCFDQAGSKIAHPGEWFSRSSDTALYAMVLKGFVPGYEYGESYDAKRQSIAHEKPVLRVLLQPRETWAAGLAGLLREWPELMKPYGYRDRIDDDKQPFNEFPLHVAIAVCAFDIDDSSFRDLAWYPCDLVDYYRAHVRQVRDAWRTGFIDPVLDLPDSARPQPETIHARSRAEAYAHWLVLVGGSGGRLDRVRKNLGKRKTMPALFRVMQALASAGLAIQADIKDDASVEEQLLALCAAHGLPPPALPARSSQGPARISVLLAALQAHAASHEGQMVVLDDDDDSWNVVLHAGGAGAEFDVLCEQLGIKRMPECDWTGP